MKNKKMTVKENSWMNNPTLPAATPRTFGVSKNVQKWNELNAKSTLRAIESLNLEAVKKGYSADTFDWRKSFTSKESGASMLELMDKLDGKESSMTASELWIAAKESGNYVDFPFLCSTNVTMKIYEQKSNETPAWQTLCAPDDAMLLDTANERASLGAIGILERNDGEAKIGEMPEAQLSVYTHQYKRAWQIEIKDIINDRMGVFGNMSANIKTACETAIEARFYSVLATPGNSTEDATAFFNATALASGGHNNYCTTALSADTAGMAACVAGRAAMMAQRPFAKDAVQTVAPLMIRPRYLAVPFALEGIANSICNAPALPVASQSVFLANQFLGQAQPIVLPMATDATDWYLFADPSELPGFVVSFLRGMTVPTVKFGWNTGGKALDSYMDADGLPLYPVYIEARHIFEVNPYDFRGAFASHQ